VKSLQKAHFGLRMQKATQQLNNTSTLRSTRRDIARAKTILAQKRATETQVEGVNMTEAKNSLKRTLIGKVVSDKRAKTVTVLVERRVKHALYGKIVMKSSKYHAHDEKGEYHTGRRDRDHREQADLQDQELGCDPPGREGREV
jgi:ribosomal protein L29